MDHKLSVKYNPMKIVDNNVGKCICEFAKKIYQGGK